MTDYQEVRTTQHEQGREQRVAGFKATQLIWLLLALYCAVLAGKRFQQGQPDLPGRSQTC